MNRRILIVTLLFSAAALTRAHEGMIHVMGTITALTDKSITVQTTDEKKIEVDLTSATTYLKGTQPAAWKDLKIGDRVVIHAVKVKDVLQAHEVRFSSPTGSSR